MKILTSDKPLNKVGIASSDVSLCKIKVKATRDNNNPAGSRKPQNDDNNNDENAVQRYVVASKKRTVVLQFQSPMQRKMNLKKSKLGKGSNQPHGAVQGIKNLPPIVPPRQMARTFVEKKRSGKPLEGTFIEFSPDEENDESRSVDTGTYDEAFMDVPTKAKTETGIEPGIETETQEENDDILLELETDDNYYQHFLKSIQCRAAVQQMKCDSIPDQRDDGFFTNEIFRDFPKTNSARGNKKKNRIDPNEVKTSAVVRPKVKALKEESELFEDRGLMNKDIFNTESDDNHISLQSTDDDSIEDAPANNQTSNNLGVAWALDNLIGGLMKYSTCGEEFDIDCGDLECDDNYNWGLTKMRENADDMSEVSIDLPTALYAAIGTKNWNVALRRLVEAPEEARDWVTTGTSEEGTVIQFLPIHLACLTNAPLLLAALLVQAYPESLMEDGMGKLPIHMACETQVDHCIVFLLLNRFPESLLIEDDEGNTPIEIASLSESSKERGKIIQVLTKEMENKVVTTPTPLYHAIDCKDWNSAVRRLVETPQESTMWVSFRVTNGETRFLPLHAACFNCAPLLLVEDLIQAYPDAIRKKTSQGKLPLHLACEALVDYRIVRLLVDQYEDALHIKNSEGHTPVEVVSNLQTCPERSNILEVLTMERRNVVKKIVFAPTKLYTLIEKKKWDSAVRRILEAPDEASTWIGACQKRTDVKYLPLHLACCLRAPLILVAVLIQSYPESVKKRNNSAELPLHLACERRTDHRVVSFLLHSWPDSFHLKDNKGQTCVQKALLSKHSEERTKIVQVLVEFEIKGGKPPTIQGLDAIEAEKVERDSIIKNVKDNSEQGKSLSNEELDMSSFQKKSKAKKKTYYTKKKNLFQKKKTKSLWDNDELMFTRE